MIVKACPICGQLVLQNCWHPDTEEVRSVEMPIQKAFRLRLAHGEQLMKDAASAYEDAVEMFEAAYPEEDE